MDNNSLINTCYGTVALHVLKKASYISLLICDVDGVMSDGQIYLGNNGEELKSFNVRDGYGIRCLITSGINVAVITGCSSRSVENRCQALGITHIYQKQSNKVSALLMLLNKLTLTTDQVAYIGDDIIDTPIMDKVGLSVAVANAHPILRLKADYITCINGGHGAVREVCDLLLLAQGKLDSTTKG